MRFLQQPPQLNRFTKPWILFVFFKVTFLGTDSIPWDSPWGCTIIWGICLICLNICSNHLKQIRKHLLIFDRENICEMSVFFRYVFVVFLRGGIHVKIEVVEKGLLSEGVTLGGRLVDQQ